MSASAPCSVFFQRFVGACRASHGRKSFTKTSTSRPVVAANNMLLFGGAGWRKVAQRAKHERLAQGVPHHDGGARQHHCHCASWWAGSCCCSYIHTLNHCEASLRLPAGQDQICVVNASAISPICLVPCVCGGWFLLMHLLSQLLNLPTASLQPRNFCDANLSQAAPQTSWRQHRQ